MAKGGFDLDAYLLEATEPPAEITGRKARSKARAEALGSAAWRRAATKADPLLFALLYFPDHLRSDQTGDKITLSEAHLDWCEDAKDLMLPAKDAAAFRRAYIAPRETGKSTWHFLILPAWAAAHGWSHFVAAFSDSSTQAETHLASFKHELENNALLREDYPDLCTPLTRGRGQVAADRVSLYRAKSGFIFAARGMDTRTLGLKVGKRRPDYLILDDVEPGEESYSAKLVEKRLRTIQDTVLPLNDKARVTLVGTVTLPDSIMHQLVKAARGLGIADWITADGWRPKYYPAIVVDAEGAERSLWPARWKLKRLQKIRHTRAYLKNYANDPIAADGDYWTVDDFTHGNLERVTRTLVSIDPAVTTKDSSDYTGIAVIGWQPPPRKNPRARGKCLVKDAHQVKMSGSAIRTHVLKMLADDPTIGLILIETNQGGETWLEILWGMPVKVKIKHQSVKKEVRAARALNHYQRGRVIHLEGATLTDAEAQMVAFPNAPNDDMVDAIGTGVAYFLDRDPKTRVGATTVQTAA